MIYDGLSPWARERIKEIYRARTDDSDWSRLDLVELLLIDGRVSEALAEYRGWAQHPDAELRAAALYRLAGVLAQLDSLVEAESVARTSIASSPTTPGYSVLADILSRRGEYEEALATLDAGIALDESNDGGWLQTLAMLYVDVLRASGRVADVPRFLEELIKRYPKSTDLIDVRNHMLP